LENATTVGRGDWTEMLGTHARSHPLIVTGLGIALIAVIALLAQGLAEAIRGGAHGNNVRLALLGGLVAFGATAIGALPALVLRGIPQKVEDVLLGGAAGMMLAAAAFSLLLPGLEAGERIAGGAAWGAAVVVTGMALGVMLMLGLDEFTPHEHDRTGPCGPGHEHCARVWLFVFSIALHNLPEGMAIGVGFAGGDASVGVPLATAIAMQDIPEGLAVAIALRSAGLSAIGAVLVAGATGFLEPVGALIGVSLSSGLALAYPMGLGLAAGAMIFVVSHEVIPETHRNGHQTAATIGLVTGFALMMTLDTTLG